MAETISPELEEFAPKGDRDRPTPEPRFCADGIDPGEKKHRFAQLLLKEVDRLDSVVSRFLDSVRSREPTEDRFLAPVSGISGVRTGGTIFEGRVF